MSANGLAERYARDADWLPWSYDEDGDAISMAELPRDRRRALVFLDPRFLGEAPRSPPIAVAALERAIPQGLPPLGFIFHTGFCCSTLLARALDIPGAAAALREPSVLVELANLWSGRTRPDTSVRALRTAMALLSRPLAAGEQPIVKPSNSATHAAAAMLDLQPGAKAVIMHVSLGDFLRSVARRKLEGRAFVRRLFRQFGPSIPLPLRFSVADMLMQTDLQLAAHVWLMQAAYFDALAEKFGRERVRTLSARALLARKMEALQRVGAFFDIAQSEAQWAAVAAGEAFSRHAKEAGVVAYDAAKRAAALEEADARYRDEIEDGERWGRELALQARAPLDLGDTLFD